MGKTLTREQRKNNKYAIRDEARAQKMKNFEDTDKIEKKPKYKQPFRRHSDCDED